jgi:Zn-finger nucleic acid-binding protein
MTGSEAPPDRNDAKTLSPEEAFTLLGNDTRVGILQALWNAFESGLGDNARTYSELFEEVDIRDSGNFSYHLEKLTGPFVRQTEDGYELKQTGINVVRAVVSGTVTQDPAFGPTAIDVDCPICGAQMQIEYVDELLLATCTRCDGLRTWGDTAGMVFLGLVPPVLMDERSVEEGFRAGVTFIMHQLAALHAGVCPHCSGIPKRWLEVCDDHQRGFDTHCPNCGRYHLSEAWMRCTTCKWQVFPPASLTALVDPAVTAFYHGHGIDHRFDTWEGLERSFDIEEEIVSQDPLQVGFTLPAGDDELRLVIDEQLNLVDEDL